MLLTTILAALALAACSSSGGAATPKASDLNDNAGSGPYQGLGLDPAQPRPSFTLTDTAGKPFAFGQQTAGHPTFLFFGYTNCPDVCPTTMIDIHDALAKQPKALQEQTYVVFVTTDIKHDTAPVIQRWLQNFSHGISAHIIGLRGTQDQIDAAQAASRIPLAEDDGKQHSALALLYGKDDYARVEYPQSSNESKSMAHDLPLVA
ncbi:MAG: SCO family protein [Jatrophihabitans sp.]|uniref:SCO family protein n=1 Tax=Jatrophihabitans sp. TaxID=1932789 RepID=UPI003F7DD02A